MISKHLGVLVTILIILLGVVFILNNNYNEGFTTTNAELETYIIVKQAYAWIISPVVVFIK